MKYKVINIVCLLALCVTWASLPRAEQTTNSSNLGKEEVISLSSLLVALGEKYNCYFTIEGAWQEGEAENGIELQDVRRYAIYNDLQSELEAIHYTYPDLNYKIVESNPTIVHIIDSRLAQNTNYALDRIILSIDFKGTVNGLVKAIQLKNINISGPRILRLSEMPFVDLRTTVGVKAEGITVREALSNFMKLDKRGRILWVARTRIGEQQISHVHFIGAPPITSDESHK